MFRKISIVVLIAILLVSCKTGMYPDPEIVEEVGYVLNKREFNEKNQILFIPEEDINNTKVLDENKDVVINELLENDKDLVYYQVTNEEYKSVMVEDKVIVTYDKSTGQEDSTIPQRVTKKVEEVE
ncbi:hypothetical protein CEY16_02810 [Halalkalibacillus sediminis]|uniref:DUF3221 domain-containing protein n=1 Tax=Halalkalibacillus sediminis TaxID=2018042 RepID=A0A2I0QWL5_9BACI|nr:hypothetical protein [Halalkalibacillus sediminis]PKR78704.1 hypothetical protein CEY16_02810 [Halalkalibacillus sediminis]